MTKYLDLRSSGNILEDNTICPRTEGEQRAIVASSRISNQAVVLSATCGVRRDMEDGSYDAADAWLDLPAGHVEVWEGRIVVSGQGSSPAGPAEYDLDYLGSWRPLTLNEREAVAAGKDLFACTECSGRGYIDLIRGS